MRTRQSKKTDTSAPLTLTIASIGAGGDGVGEFQGKPVYVAKTVPGDVVRAHIEKQNADGITARLVDVVTAGPDRADAPCPVYAQCGGCNMQHVSAKFYHDWKVQKVRTTLERANVTPTIWKDPVFLPAPTRRRTSMSARKTGNGAVILGYNQARTHNILDIVRCLVLDPALDAKMQALRPYLPQLLPENVSVDIMLQSVDGALDMVLTGKYQTRGKFSLDQHEVMGEIANDLDIARISFREKDFTTPEILLTRKPVRKIFGAVTVDLPPGAFLQASRESEEVLSTLVRSAAEGAQNIADLFAGSGTFSGAVLQSSAKVMAVEDDANAIKALATTRHPKLKTLQRDLFKFPLNGQELAAFDTVIIDPPRGGAKEQADMLAWSAVPRIISVSCNPATFTRDARILQDGGYTLEWLAMVDQFVWSAHIELIGLFTK